MTGNAAALRPRRARHVLRVIKFHVEVFLELVGKTLPRRILAVHIRVADRTHGSVGRGELRSMAFEAILVTG